MESPVSMNRIVLVAAGLGAAIGCGGNVGGKDDCNGGDTADLDRLKVVIDHVEQDGEYIYVYVSGYGTNECRFTAPLGEASPVCDLQGGAVVVETDQFGITSFFSATEGSGGNLSVRRDGIEVYAADLEPTWSAWRGDEGCHVYDIGEAKVSF